MGQLIEDLLKLSRITRAEMSYNKVNLSELASSIVEDLQEDPAGTPGRIYHRSGPDGQGRQATAEHSFKKYPGKCLEVQQEMPANPDRDGNRSAKWRKCLLYPG